MLMKAVQVAAPGGPEVLEWKNVPLPAAGKGRGQVLVKINAAGVNPLDTYLRSGSYTTNLAYPYTPGIDGAGIVEQTGKRVYLSGSISGTYAEYALCREDQIHPLPDHLSFAQGAGIHVPYATAYRALFQKARAKAGETVLVHGASGGVGLACVQLARAHGMQVWGTAGTQGGIELVAKCGAHRTFNHSSQEDKKKLATAAQEGVHLILEMLANLNLNWDLELLSKNGRIVVIGSRGKTEIDPRFTMSKECSVMGMTILSAEPKDLAEIEAGLQAGFANRTLTPIINCELPLRNAAQAHQLILAPGACGKIVLIP